MKGFRKVTFEQLKADVNVNSLLKALKFFFERKQNRYIYALIKIQSSKIKGDFMGLFSRKSPEEKRANKFNKKITLQKPCQNLSEYRHLLFIFVK